MRAVVISTWTHSRVYIHWEVLGGVRKEGRECRNLFVLELLTRTASNRGREGALATGYSTQYKGESERERNGMD